MKGNMRGIIVAGTILAAILIGCMTLLIVMDKSTAEIRQLLETVFGFVTLILAGGGFVYARNASSNASTAAEQTNGALEGRIADAVTAALNAQRGRIETQLRAEAARADRLSHPPDDRLPHRFVATPDELEAARLRRMTPPT